MDELMVNDQCLYNKILRYENLNNKILNMRIEQKVKR